MKILVIDSSIRIPETEHKTISVSHTDGLLSFLIEQPDIVFCYAEYFGEVVPEKDKPEAVLYDIRNSLSSSQRLIRLGFTTGGPDQFLRLPFSIEEFKACLQG